MLPSSTFGRQHGMYALYRPELSLQPRPRPSLGEHGRAIPTRQ